MKFRLFILSSRKKYAFIPKKDVYVCMHVPTHINAQP